MLHAILLAAFAGGMIPLGALIASREHMASRWREARLRHAIIAFGGGALLAAVALVLVPKGVDTLPGWAAIGIFGLGGVAFAWADDRITRRAGARGQLIAMLSDFIPEAVALGALLATGDATALLLAFLIGVQNLPEGFNAFCEMKAGGREDGAILLRFSCLAVLGPVAAVAGLLFLAGSPAILGLLMMFAAGGILYLIFQDIAPQAPLRDAWGPPLGAVAGFMLGLAGHVLVG